MGDDLKPIASSVIQLPIGAFACCWREYQALGIQVVPLRESEKRPAIRLSRRMGPEAYQELAKRFPRAGIGIRTGRISNIIVIDIDAHGHPERVPELILQIEARCGPTPLKVWTPSGGCHLYYRSSGERSENPAGAARDALPVDVRGEGGIAVAPPTFIAGKGEYRLLEGDLSEIARLPKVRPGSLPLHRKTPQPATPGTALAAPSRKLREGEGRNNAVYRHVADAAWFAKSEAGLLLEAHRIDAERCADPLPEGELLRMVAGLWQKKQRGELAPPLQAGQPYVRMSFAEIQKYDPHAFMMLAALRMSHQAERGKTFALSPRRMKEGSPIFSTWPRREIERAPETLARGGSLQLIRKGRRGRGTPAQYQLILPTRSVLLGRAEAAAEKIPTAGNNRPNHPPRPPGDAWSEASRKAAGRLSGPACREALPGHGLPQGAAPPSLPTQPISFEKPSSPSSFGRASRPGGSPSETGRSLPVSANTPKAQTSPLESSGGKISPRADRQGGVVGTEPVQTDLVEYLSGEDRTVPLAVSEAREFMAEERLSQRALARRAGIPPGSLFPWLAGKQPLSPENEARLRHAMLSHAA